MIPTYMLIISLTYCAGIIWLYLRSKNQSYEVETSQVLDLCLIIMISGFLGGRLTHVFYENWSHYKNNFLDVLQIWHGGFVFYGGFVAALTASLIYLKRKRAHFLKYADFFAPVLAFGYGIGRMGCFFAGCCYGQLCEGASCAWPWFIEFSHPGLPTGLRHPTPLYATFWELCVGALLLVIAKKFHSRTNAGTVFFSWLVMHGLGRLLMEHFRDDNRGSEMFGLSISSVFSLAMIVVASYLLLKLKRIHKSV